MRLMISLSLPQSNSEICFNELSTVPGLNPVMPSGAMYLMVSTKSVCVLFWSWAHMQIFFYVKMTLKLNGALQRFYTLSSLLLSEDKVTCHHMMEALTKDAVELHYIGYKCRIQCFHISQSTCFSVQFLLYTFKGFLCVCAHLSRWGLTWITFQILRTMWTSLSSW